MTDNKQNVTSVDNIAVRFTGDSGDGMQLAGNIFSTISATEHVCGVEYLFH